MRDFGTKILCVMLLALPGAVLAAESTMSCDSVNFGAEVLAKFPNAQKGCIDLSQRNDGVYAHYRAEVVKVEGDTITVNMLDRDGKALSKVKFVPAADETVNLSGKDTKYKDLAKGQKIDLYI